MGSLIYCILHEYILSYRIFIHLCYFYTYDVQLYESLRFTHRSGTMYSFMILPGCIMNMCALSPTIFVPYFISHACFVTYTCFDSKIIHNVFWIRYFSWNRYLCVVYSIHLSWYTLYAYYVFEPHRCGMWTFWFLNKKMLGLTLYQDGHVRATSLFQTTCWFPKWEVIQNPKKNISRPQTVQKGSRNKPTKKIWNLVDKPWKISAGWTTSHDRYLT